MHWRPPSLQVRGTAKVDWAQLSRDFGKSRAKEFKDIKDRLPRRQRAGMPRWKGS